MSQRELAEFTVRIHSTERASWQGEVEGGGETFRFESEMELFRWLLKRWPELVPRPSPDTAWLKQSECNSDDREARRKV